MINDWVSQRYSWKGNNAHEGINLLCKVKVPMLFFITNVFITFLDNLGLPPNYLSHRN